METLSYNNIHIVFDNNRTATGEEHNEYFNAIKHYGFSRYYCNGRAYNIYPSPPEGYTNTNIVFVECAKPAGLSTDYRYFTPVKMQALSRGNNSFLSPFSSQALDALFGPAVPNICRWGAIDESLPQAFGLKQTPAVLTSTTALPEINIGTNSFRGSKRTDIEYLTEFGRSGREGDVIHYYDPEQDYTNKLVEPNTRGQVPIAVINSATTKNAAFQIATSSHNINSACSLFTDSNTSTKALMPVLYNKNVITTFNRTSGTVDVYRQKVLGIITNFTAEEAIKYTGTRNLIKNLMTLHRQQTSDAEEVLAILSSSDITTAVLNQEEFLLKYPRYTNWLLQRFNKEEDIRKVWFDVQEPEPAFEPSLFNLLNAQAQLKNSAPSIALKRAQEILDTKKKELEKAKEVLVNNQAFISNIDLSIQSFQETIDKYTQDRIKYLAEIEAARPRVESLEPGVLAVETAVAKRLEDFQTFAAQFTTENDRNPIIESLNNMGVTIVNLVYVDANGPVDVVNNPQAVLNDKAKLQQVRFVTHKPTPFTLFNARGQIVENEPTRMGGPYEMDLTFNNSVTNVRLRPRHPGACVGVRTHGRDYLILNPHPHVGTREYRTTSHEYIKEFFTMWHSPCQGELASALSAAFKSNDFKHVVYACMAFLTTANISDQYGRSAIYFPKEKDVVLDLPTDESELPPEVDVEEEVEVPDDCYEDEEDEYFDDEEEDYDDNGYDEDDDEDEEPPNVAQAEPQMTAAGTTNFVHIADLVISNATTETTNENNDYQPYRR